MPEIDTYNDHGAADAEAVSSVAELRAELRDVRERLDRVTREKGELWVQVGEANGEAARFRALLARLVDKAKGVLFFIDPHEIGQTEEELQDLIAEAERELQ